MRKKIGVSLLALALSLAAFTPALARTVISDLGYSVQLPEGWIAMEKSSLKNQSKTIDAALSAAQKDQGIEAIPAKVLQGVKDLFDQGKIDLYYSDTPGFYITVFESVGNIADKGGQAGDVCREYKEKLAKEAGSMVVVQQCGAASVNTHPAVRLVATDYQKGKKFIQYLVQKTDDKVLLFTANSQSADFGVMNSDFGAIMDTVDIK